MTKSHKALYFCIKYSKKHSRLNFIFPRMEKEMKKLSVMLLVTVVALLSVVSATMAYFTDSVSSDNNVIVSGNIRINQKEQQRVTAADGSFTGGLTEFTQNQLTKPVVNLGSCGYGSFTVDGHTVSLRNAEGNGYMDKIVNVENAGTNPAYIRTFIALPTSGYKSSSPLDDNWLHWDAVYGDDSWSWGKPVTAADGTVSAQSWPATADGWNMLDDVVINGVEYDVYIATYTDMLPAGEISLPSMVGFYIDSKVGNDASHRYFYKDSAGQMVYLDGISPVQILVATQAVQTTTFTDPWTALDTAFGATTAANNPWTNDNAYFGR